MYAYNMILNIWRVIELPSISITDLEYELSFRLFLFKPEQAKIFIQKSIKTGYLVKENDKTIRLSNNLKIKHEKWQKRAKRRIIVRQNKKMVNNYKPCIECNKILLDKGKMKLGKNGTPLCYEQKRCPI